MNKEEKSGAVTRRDFMKTGLGAASLASIGAAGFLPRRVLGANDRVRVAVVGLHGRGMDHIRAYSRIHNAEIAALCDVYEKVLEERLGDMDKMGLPKPASYTDIRKLLEDKSIDAISIATPNDWHSLMGIWACQAGKDVYVEKPCCHNLWEGQQLVSAAARYGRMVQHGTQSRSLPSVRDAVDRIGQGLVGDLYLSRGLCYKWRNTIGIAPVEPVPAGLDYDLWTGPAPLHAFTRNRFLYNWHWFWWYGNGDLGNQGVHQIDIARWGLGVGYPNKASAIGGHFMFKDDQETPNTLNCAFEFDLPGGKRRMLEFEVRHWITNHEAGIGERTEQQSAGPHPKLGPNSGTNNTIGDIFYGSKGYLAVGSEDSGAYKTWLGEAQEPGPSGNQPGGDVLHFQNFIDCVVSRKKEDLHAPIEEGVASCALIHLANASYRLGRTLNFDPDTQKVINDPEADTLLRDGDRGYRAPYVVPEEV
ncbi:MAG: Gfo/Idh/MocA family oxidoreductase [Acidobacteriota bacterium]|nr:Gfo/Idh/MocA family oxidoreductase [Acidobacteriota bacterium]